MPAPSEAADRGGGTGALRPLIRLRLPASEPAVRRTLQDVGRHLRRLGLDDEMRAAAELVLAEALNNVVRHAYRDLPADGADDIALDLDLAEDGIAVTVRDRGRALPGGRLPDGRLPDVGTDRDGLPEGGFGWFLIRRLSRDLAYDRGPAGNRLRFLLPR